MKKKDCLDLPQITLEVCRIAKDTGSYLAAERKQFLMEEVEEKTTHDYVSYVDREAEKMAVRELSSLLPEADFMTEEGTVEQTIQKQMTWVIDSLDGTLNFIQDFAPYCVSIALQKGHELLVGVVYEVTREECYFAWKGGNAFMNGHPIHVSDRPIEEAFIGLEMPYHAEEYKPVVVHAIEQLYGKVAGIRMNGSAAAALCNVASGRYDGWAEAFIKSWDYSAGVLIVREAGGIVTDFKGNEKLSGTHCIVATNKHIHEELWLVMRHKPFF